MRLQSLRHKALTLGLLSLGSVGVATNAMSGEFLRRVHPSRYVEAPVEPAPPNAGYYPTRWNRWDSEQAYLPGLRKPQVPAETPPTGEELPQPKGDVAPPPLEKSAPKRDGDTAPRPGVPAPFPSGGDLPPLPGTPNELPEPAPMPVKPEPGELPPPRQPVPPPGPDMLTPPPSVEQPKPQPKVETPREPETSPPPMELPPPQLPMEEKSPAPEPKQPEPQEPNKEPTDNLFEAPPRKGEKNENKGAGLIERPNIRTTRATGQWVASGGSATIENKPQREVATVSDTEEAPLQTIDHPSEHSPDGKPARLPVDDEAVPLSAVDQRPAARVQTTMPVGAAIAKFKPLRDTEVPGVSWTEPVQEGARPLPNPLRRQ